MRLRYAVSMVRSASIATGLSLLLLSSALPTSCGGDGKKSGDGCSAACKTEGPA